MEGKVRSGPSGNKSLGAVTPKQEEWLQQILVNTSEVSVYKSAAI